MSIRIAVRIILIAYLAVQSAIASTTEDDVLLHKVIQAYLLKPLNSQMSSLGPKETLGRALFFDPIISGPKNIACAACHTRHNGGGDGISLSVGLGGSGIGESRIASHTGFVIPRNALPLFERGNFAFRAYFWDGRVQPGENDKFETPLGDNLPIGFESLLAAASILPLAEEDEMLGRGESKATPDIYHAGLVTLKGNALSYQERTRNAFGNLINRLLQPQATAPDACALEYRTFFKQAYPNANLGQINITHVGNALAAYISRAFALQPAAWDRYVSGDTTAITNLQKRGAVIFYGKGRCAVCHSGTLFSDFEFHGLAIPQLRPGKQGRYTDYGRAAATGRRNDRYLFRTPPLRNVVETGPWGHNGYFSTLKGVIEHHFNPVPALFQAQQIDPNSAAFAGRLLGFRSDILAEIAPLSPDIVDELVAFLGSLSSETYVRDSEAVPSTVPSGRLEFAKP
jgi:cytochrome c peroxidase